MARRMMAIVLLVAASGVARPAAAVEACEEPGAAWTQREPASLGLDAARLQEALDWADLHTSYTVVVVRHGCLAGRSRLDQLIGAQPWDGWSMTKSITAMLVGRAVTLGLMDIDEPIAALYPEADEAHGAITPRLLLTQTSGLKVNWVRDLAPQPDRVRDALSQPFEFAPGTEWQYGQSVVTLLADVLERAVGKDLQDWAHEQLFAPLGITRDAWKWERDRAGHTEGWAHLHMRSADFARFGQLMLEKGEWQGEQLIAESYVQQMITPGEINNAYGFLWWLNSGGNFILPDVEGPDEGEGPLIPTGPADMFLMAGAGEQRTYVIPSRDMVIVRLGERGSREADTRASVWTGRGGELDIELIRMIMRAVTDVPYADPGPYTGSDPFLPPPDQGIVGDAQDVVEVLGGVGVGPAAPQGCTPLGCD